MTEKYDGDSIETLEWPECVKKRPGMYIGGSGADGMHHLLWEIFDNATDEAVAGHCTNIIITNEADGYITVLDDGRGIPCDINKKTGRNALELVVAQLHAGGKFHNEAEDGGYKVSGGLHGCGAAVCNALSEHFQVFVKRSNRTYTVEYRNGTRTCEVHEVKDCPVTWLSKTGTFVRFKPDKLVFKHCRLEWERARVLRRARETAFLVSGLSVTLQGWKGENEADVTFRFEKGLHDYVTYLFEGKERLTEDFELNVELPKELGCTADVVFAYEMKYDECLTTFANNICTFEGGVHREAFLSALLKVVVEVGEDEKLLREFGGRVKKSDVTEGFIGVVSVRARQPEFEGQTKTKLGNPELRGPLEEAFLAELRKQFKKRKEDFVKVSTKVIEALKARDAAMKAKELTRKKGGLERFAFQGKLAACESNDPSCCELYTCEGDSAGGSAKQGRNRRFQAILPFRGKVINAEKHLINKTLENKEIQALISALGVTPSRGGNVPDIEELRYHKVIIMCFAGETRVQLLNGQTFTMQELAEGKAGKKFWLYGADENGNFTPALGFNAHYSGETKELVEVVFEDDSSFRCTPDHLFRVQPDTVGAQKLHGCWFKPAGELTADDSLVHLNIQRDMKGYEEVFRDGRWEKTYRITAAQVKPKEMKSCRKRIMTKTDRVIVHHKNFNINDNSPENLEWKTFKEHVVYHASLNATPERRKKLSQWHKEGRYTHTYWGKNKYNGSPEHIAAIKRMFLNPEKRAQCERNMRDYNKSDYHRLVASFRNKIMWQDPEYRKKMSTILAEFSRKHGKLISKNVRKQWKDPEKRKRIFCGRGLRVLNDIMRQAPDIFDGNIVELKTEYDKRRYKSVIRFDNLLAEHNNSVESLREAASCYNARIKQVKKITLGQQVPVYDISVKTVKDDTHSFMIHTTDYGIIVKNSDADVDGAHITCLMLTFFYKFMRTLIEQGHIYVANPPLFRLRKGNSVTYVLDDEKLEEFRKTHDMAGYEVNRFKGLGEMNPEQLAETTLNPATRNIVQVTVEDAAQATRTIEMLMGADIQGRKNFLFNELAMSDVML